MQLLRRHTSRASLFAAFAGIAILAAACTDRSDPVGPGPGGEGPGGPVGPPGNPVTIQSLVCSGSRVAKSLSCGSPEQSSEGARADRIVINGPNGEFVRLTSSNVNYDGPTEIFSFDVTVRNLISQPLGTRDTTGALTPLGGVVLFFTTVPTKLGEGAGAVDIVNADGDSAFTAGLQPFYQYNTVLEQFEVSAPKTWQFKMPITVDSFHFVLKVAAEVPYPNGWIEVQGNSDVRPGFERQLTAVVRDRMGQLADSASLAGMTFNWFSSDSTRAKVGDSGLVKGLRFGSTAVGVEATLGGQPISGKKVMNVRRTRRIWAGTVDTDWNKPGNWRPAATLNPDAAGEFNVVPEAQDTAVIPDNPAISNFPVLNENENIGGVEVFRGSIALNAFNLTATGSVLTDPLTSGQITSTSGRLVLAGIAQTVRGNVPRLLVTGTYSLDGNLTVMQQIRVQSGRLRNQTFRLRQVPN